MPACRIGGRAHGNGQIRRDIEQSDFAEQTVDAACRADDLIQCLIRHNGGGIGQGVECVCTLFRLCCIEGTLFTFRQGLAQQVLEERAAVFRGIVGVDVGCGLIHDRAFDGVKVHRFVLSGSRLYIGLRIRGAVYDADFVYSADFRDGAFASVFVPFLMRDVERKGHLRQVSAPHGFIYAAALLGVRQFCTHFKAVVGDVQRQGFRASGKGNPRAVVIHQQRDVFQIDMFKGAAGNAFRKSVHVGGLVENDCRSLDHQRAFCCPDFIGPGFMPFVHDCPPPDRRPPCRRLHS